jgi:hypothetical protein
LFVYFSRDRLRLFWYKKIFISVTCAVIQWLSLPRHVEILTCGPFLQELNNSIDIYLLQEHWLLDCQLKLLNEIHQQYTGVGKAVDSNDPITPLRLFVYFRRDRLRLF